MVAGDAAADAVRRARSMPDLRVGLHVVAVEGRAVLPAAEIRDLVDADGWFPADQVRLGFRYAFSRRARAELAREITAQFAAFAATGLRFAHVDAHKHMQMSLYVGSLLAANMRAYNVPRMRIPAEPPAVMLAAGTRTGVGGWAMRQWSRVLRARVRGEVPEMADAVFGVAWSGHMTEARLLRLIAHLPDGESEIYFHPAARRDAVIDRLMPEYEHEAELAALLSPAVRAALGR
jgi:hopanoid biosynthesis associated protein HpnK